MSDVERLIGAMSLDEKCSLTAGANLWYLPPVERLGIGALKVSDGPSGVRGDSLIGRRSLSLPCGMAVGSTWNPELVGRLGEVLAAEARSKGVHVVLGPTICIARLENALAAAGESRTRNTPGPVSGTSSASGSSGVSVSSWASITTRSSSPSQASAMAPTRKSSVRGRSSGASSSRPAGAAAGTPPCPPVRLSTSSRSSSMRSAKRLTWSFSSTTLVTRPAEVACR